VLLVVRVDRAPQRHQLQHVVAPAVLARRARDGQRDVARLAAVRDDQRARHEHQQRPAQCQRALPAAALQAQAVAVQVECESSESKL
jgi:hypothetical protein